MLQACQCSSRFDTSERGSKESTPTQKAAISFIHKPVGRGRDKQTGQQVDRRAREQQEMDTLETL
jgi:hypothetical protein